MVWKRSKYGINTGNTVRKSERFLHRTQTPGIITGRWTNREWVEERMKTIFENKYATLNETEEYSILNNLLSNDEALLDSDTVSLNKKWRWMIWEDLLCDVKNLLSLQNDAGTTTVSISVTEEHGYLDTSQWHSVRPLSKVRPDYRNEPESSCKCQVWPHTYRGIQRKCELPKRRSEAKKEAKEASLNNS